MSWLSRSTLDYLDPYGIGYGGFGGFGGFGDGIDRRGFAPVSNRAYGAFDRASDIFFKHLASVDTGNGDVETEIIKFHLVPDMRKRFNKLVKEHGCRATSRQLSRWEQDAEAEYKHRQTLVWFTSVKVTPTAQKAYLDKNPTMHPNAGATSASAPSASTTVAPAVAQAKSLPLTDTTAATSKKRNAQDAGLDAGVASGKPKVKKAKAAAVTTKKN